MSGILTGAPVGISSHRIEADGRLTIPQRVRPLLSYSFVIMPSAFPCLILMPQAAYTQAIARWEGPLSVFDPDAGILDRHFVGTADVVSCDRQGRVVVSQELRDMAKLHGDVKILALRDRVEVWDAATYDEYTSALTQERIQESLNKKLGFRQTAEEAA